MKTVFIAGNWKSNKNTIEASNWLFQFNEKYQISNVRWDNVSIVLFVPFTLLSVLKQEIDRLGLPIQLGAQNVSPFSDGAYTGEISARMVKEFASWVTIGHSERRTHFGEREDMLMQKVSEAKKEKLKIVYGVPDSHAPIPSGVDVVAYEPPSAIGAGKTAEDPKTANTVIDEIKRKHNISEETLMIYGGSVSVDNIASFVAQLLIDGILSGRASLDPESFFYLIQSASTAL